LNLLQVDRMEWPIHSLQYIEADHLLRRYSDRRSLLRRRR
jgi:hypothetical protein